MQQGLQLLCRRKVDLFCLVLAPDANFLGVVYLRKLVPESALPRELPRHPAAKGRREAGELAFSADGTELLIWNKYVRSNEKHADFRLSLRPTRLMRI